jgi:hypothetical protein
MEQAILGTIEQYRTLSENQRERERKTWILLCRVVTHYVKRFGV